MFALGAEQADSLETDALIEGIQGVEFDSPQGHIRVDPATRHATHAFHVAEITGNTWEDFRIVHTEDEIPPATDCGEIPGITG
jgi:hypothetical protein